jgi:hypothetical protein
MSRPTRKQLEKIVTELEACETVDCKMAVMNQINDGRLTMRSRWFVMTEYLGLRTTWVLLVLTAIVLVNLILYMISQGPERIFMEFGSSSTSVVLQNLPYGWMALASALLIASILLMRSFSFTHIWSFHVFVILVISSVFVAGGVTFASGLNDDVFEKYVMGEEGDSLLAKLYCFCNNRKLDTDKALIGEVFFEINEGEFVLQTPELEVVTIMHGPGTKWHGESAELARFSSLKMIGQRYGDRFVATHVKIDDKPSTSLASTNCEEKEERQRRLEIAELRKRVIETPMTHGTSPVTLIRSIY